MYKVLSFLFLVTLLSSGSSVIAADAPSNCKTLGDVAHTLYNKMEDCFASHGLKDCDPTKDTDAAFCACLKNNREVMHKDCSAAKKAFILAFKEAQKCTHRHHTYPKCHPSKKNPTPVSKKDSK